MKTAIALALGATALAALWFAVRLWIRLRFPPEIPPDLAFRHELTTDRTLRQVAEALARRFGGPTPDQVVCLGPVRGTAARILFHSGPDNPGRGEIHRPDYLVHVRRLGPDRVVLELGLNRPYSDLRIRRSELEPLVRALRATYGPISSLT